MMQALLPFFNLICLFASILYIIRHSRVWKPWILAVLATAVLSIFLPKLMIIVGNASLTVYLASGVGIIIFILAVLAVGLAPASSSAKEKSEVEEAETPRTSLTQIRYLYGSVRAEAGEKVRDEPDVESIGDIQLPERKRGFAVRFAAWRERNAERKREFYREGSLAEQRKLSVWAGDFDVNGLLSAGDVSEEQLNGVVDEIYEESFVYEDPDRNVLEIGVPEGIETRVVKPARSPAVKAKKAGKQHEQVRLDDAMLMDLAFKLMNEGKWSDAADVFLSFRESTEAGWLRKQADVERLNALIHANRIVEAVDLVFFILGSAYDLSDQERAQIESVLRGLQGG